MNNNSYDFFIRSPKWQKNTFIGFFVFGVAGAIAVTILWLILKFDWGILAGAMLIFAISLILSLLGLYVWHKEVFYFKNQIFTYIKPFKKSQSAELSQISRVEISHSGILRITFIGKNGEKLISFFDDGTSFRNNELVSALMHYNIPITNK